ncbi:MAG: M23 family metallopeptidase [Erysipelotrichaceae bacterium]|nr:M23 family metallopeptidase [Erysipelotrichaceae bacterium]
MKKLYVFLMKSLICIILFLVMAIICKSNVQYKDYIKSRLYEDRISFSSFKKFYDQYLGGVFPIEEVSSGNINYVFHDTLMYDAVSSYEEGVALTVSSHYLIPSIEEGIVVYIGEKEKYNQVIMIENKDGIDIWYGNVCNFAVKLYDTVSAGTYLGESCDSTLYLVYTKGNQYLDYEDYFQS